MFGYFLIKEEKLIDFTWKKSEYIWSRCNLGKLLQNINQYCQAAVYLLKLYNHNVVWMVKQEKKQ